MASICRVLSINASINASINSINSINLKKTIIYILTKHSTINLNTSISFFHNFYHIYFMANKKTQPKPKTVHTKHCIEASSGICCCACTNLGFCAHT